MRIIAKSTLTRFAAKHPESTAGLSHWHAVVRAAAWSTMSDVMEHFPKAKVLNAERVRFAISGGSYRLIVSVDFSFKVVFVKFIGTHAEYDEVDALTVSQF